MSKLTPLSKFEHTRLKISESSDYSRFKSQHIIPIVVQEFTTLSSEFPIVFIKNAESGEFNPVAMMGVKNNVNLYCQDSTWTSPVTPIGFSNAPLSLIKQSPNSPEVMVCVDEESELISSTNGQALFQENGDQTEYLVARSKKLLDVDEYSQQTKTIIKFLASKGLLCNRQLNLKLTNENEQYTINGIYVIDENVLNNLPSDEFEQIRSRGLLTFIYAHLNSLHQVARLTMKQNLFDKTKSE